MVWQPLFGPDSSDVAVKVEKNGRQTIVINGKPWKRECEEVWDPAFSPDGVWERRGYMATKKYGMPVVQIGGLSC